MTAQEGHFNQMPAAFIGHGSPMNALELNQYTAAWRAFGRAVPRPRAILVASAHWFIGSTALTAMERPRTIHDFYGFPQALFDVRYPAPGMPEMAGEVAEVVSPTAVRADRETWGLDHGNWIILVHAFPDASVPVLELSINGRKDLDYHFELGRRLAPLRERGVLLVFSGNIVHNLRAADFRHVDNVYGWAGDFDDAAHEQLLSDPASVLGLGAHPHYRDAVPTPDHFLPFVQFAGLASASSGPADVLVAGRLAGSISMTSYTVGMEGPHATAETVVRSSQVEHLRTDLAAIH
jgi:4,5-DOPA dioxygenase extradiol